MLLATSTVTLDACAVQATPNFVLLGSGTGDPSVDGKYAVQPGYATYITDFTSDGGSATRFYLDSNNRLIQPDSYADSRAIVQPEGNGDGSLLEWQTFKYFPDGTDGLYDLYCVSLGTNSGPLSCSAAGGYSKFAWCTQSNSEDLTAVPSVAFVANFESGCVELTLTPVCLP